MLYPYFVLQGEYRGDKALVSYFNNNIKYMIIPKTHYKRLNKTLNSSNLNYRQNEQMENSYLVNMQKFQPEILKVINTFNKLCK